MGVSRGKMSQKSISSFFSKAATKKVEEKKSTNVDNEENQNPAKTKTSQDKSSPTLAKKRVGVIGSDSEDDSKENSKVLANKAKDVSKEPIDEKKEDSEAAALDADGLPPLRKTVRNPAFKRRKKWKLRGLLKRRRSKKVNYVVRKIQVKNKVQARNHRRRERKLLLKVMRTHLSRKLRLGVRRKQLLRVMMKMILQQSQKWPSHQLRRWFP